MPKPLELDAKWRKFAESRCEKTGLRLTLARMGVYAELVVSDQPLSAYELISRQEKRLERKIAPLTVYRHLNFLIEVGLVHKLESTHKYVPCGHPDHAHESHYLLCSSCGRADELESRALEKMLSDMANQHGFQPAKAVVEMTGLCFECAANEK